MTRINDVPDHDILKRRFGIKMKSNPLNNKLMNQQFDPFEFLGIKNKLSLEERSEVVRNKLLLKIGEYVFWRLYQDLPRKTKQSINVKRKRYSPVTALAILRQNFLDFDKRVAGYMNEFKKKFLLNLDI